MTLTATATIATIATTALLVGLRGLGKGRTERQGTDGCKGDEFHMLRMMTGQVGQWLQKILQANGATRTFVTVTGANLSSPLVWRSFG